MERHLSQVVVHCIVFFTPRALLGLHTTISGSFTDGLFQILQGLLYLLVLPYVAKTYPRRINGMWHLATVYRLAWMVLVAGGWFGSRGVYSTQKTTGTTSTVSFTLLEALVTSSIQPVSCCGSSGRAGRVRQRN